MGKFVELKLALEKLAEEENTNNVKLRGKDYAKAIGWGVLKGLGYSALAGLSAHYPIKYYLGKKHDKAVDDISDYVRHNYHDLEGIKAHGAQLANSLSNTSALLGKANVAAQLASLGYGAYSGYRNSIRKAKKRLQEQQMQNN